MNKEEYDRFDKLLGSVSITKLIEFSEFQNKTGNFVIINLDEYIKERQKMHKTIDQWLKENLSEDQYENAKKCKYEDWDTKVDCLSKAISMGFYWADMPEGWEYWDRYDTLVESEL